MVYLYVQIFVLVGRYELHMELQLYRRGWIKQHIETLQPLAPESLCPSEPEGYNLTLSQGPSYIPIHAGLSLEHNNDCYAFAGLVPSAPLPQQVLPEQVTYHLYWRADLHPLGERQVLLIQSVLATQSRDHSKVVLWSNDGDKLLANPTTYRHLKPIFGEYAERFSVQSVNIRTLAASTPLNAHPLLAAATDKKAWLDGDLVRVLLLYHYGGVWVDMDSVLLRDMRPLLESEWVTQWDCYDKPYAPLNGAMMHFYAKSPHLCQMMYAMSVEPAPRPGTTDWGSLLYHKVWRRTVAAGKRPFSILPWCFTDGRSCRLDNRLPDPFEPDPPYHSSRWDDLSKRIDSIVCSHFRLPCVLQRFTNNRLAVCHSFAQPVGEGISCQRLGEAACPSQVYKDTQVVIPS